VTLDLGGYKSGSMNKVLKKELPVAAKEVAQ